MTNSSLLEEVLDGRYPGYSIDTFSADIAFSILNQIDQTRKAIVLLTPSAFDNERIRYTVDKILKSSLKNAPDVILGENVPAAEISRIEYIVEKKDKSADLYNRFNSYLASKNLVCSPEEFRIIQLADEYQRFKAGESF